MRRSAMLLLLAMLAVPVALTGAPTAPAQAADLPQCSTQQGNLWQMQRLIAEEDVFSRTYPGQRGQNLFDTSAPAETALPEPDFGGLSVAAPGLLWNDYSYGIKADGSGKQEADSLIGAQALLVRAPEHAQSFSLDADGSFRYVPHYGYFGVDTFEYIFALGTGTATVCSSPQLVTIEQSGLPYPVSDRYTVYNDAPLSFVGRPCGHYCGVLDNELNLPIPPLAGFSKAYVTGVRYGGVTRSLASLASIGGSFSLTHGVVSNVTAEGTFVYTPNPGAVGTDTFTYRMSRDFFEGRTWEATVTLDVKAVPPVEQPLGYDDVVTGTEDTPLMISAAALRANDPRATYISYVGTMLYRADTWDTPGGTLSIATAEVFPDGIGDDRYATTLTYTPDPDFDGVDRFTYYVATAYPWNTSPEPVTVLIDLADVPDVPIAGVDVAQTREDTPVTIDLLANDHDGDGAADIDVASLIEVPQCPSGCANGTWTLNGDGTVTYEPSPDFVGLGSFRYRISDRAGHHAEASVYVDVSRDDAVDDHYTVAEDGVLVDADPGVSTNDDAAVFATPAGTPIVAPTTQLVSPTSHGTLEFLPGSGGFTYTPDAGYIGPDSFVYRYTNAGQTLFSDTATVTIDVQAVNDPPAITLQPLCLTGELCLHRQLRDVAEGGSEITVSGSLTDVEFDPGTLTIAWGDGTSSGPLQYPCEAPCAFGTTPTYTTAVPCISDPSAPTSTCPLAQYFALTHTYVDDPPGAGDMYAITVTADDGASRIAGTQARVRNLPPTLTVTSAMPAAYPLKPITINGTVSDPVDPRTLKVDWGDGSPAAPVSLTCGVGIGANCAFTAEHSYAATGSYTVTLTAADDDGGTDVETRTASITAEPGVTPNAPTGVSGVGGDARVDLTWVVPAPNSGAPVSGYVVEYSTDGGVGWTTIELDNPATSATITGLTNTIAHDFRVAAVSAAGRGPYSAPLLTVVPIGLPSAQQLDALPDTLPLETSTVVLGQLVTVDFSGFDPNEAVAVMIQSTPRLLATTHADANGAISVAVELPADLELGLHTLSAFGTESGFGASATIQVVAVDEQPPGFVGVAPARLVDTRAAEQQGLVPVDQHRYGGDDVLRVKVTGVAGVPAAGVAAVAVNVTAIGPDSAGFVTVFPCGDRPLVSSLNYVAGQVVPNAVIAPVSPDGELCLFSKAATDLVVDVNGWFPTGSDFAAVAPVRLVDTRPTEPEGLVAVAKQTYAGEQVLRVRVTGVGEVPATGVSAVALNVTVVDPAGPGYVTVYPCGERPLVSSLNYVAGQVVPNAVLAPVSPDGEVCLFAKAETHLLIDVNGWFAGGGGFAPVAPRRLVDSRPTEPQGAVAVAKQRYGGEHVLRVRVTDVAGVPAAGVGAVALNVTAVDPSAAGYVSVYPCGERPLVSSVNYVAGQVVPNAVIAAVSPEGDVCLFSKADTHLLVDVNGWFASV